MSGLRRLTFAARRVGRLLWQYQPQGPLVYDRAESRWLALPDDYHLQGLTLTLLRLQRGPRLVEAGLPRRVTYVRDGDHEYLEAEGRRYNLDSTAVGFLEVVLDLLEEERNLGG